MNETQDTQPEDKKQDPAARASFWSELKRRHVIRVASVYSVVAWVVIQVASTTFEGFGIPVWAFRFVVLMLLLGLPFSLIITWALELTPEGVKRIPPQRKRGPVKIESASLRKKRRRLSVAFAAAVPSLIFGTLALVFYLRLGNQPGVDPMAQPLPTEQSIAVLPLLNMSDVDANAFFASGVHEDILTNLSRIDGLKVVSRTSVMRFINSEMSLRDIGAELGVNYIVEGSVRRINNHVRVTVQLIDARNDTHLWANNYDRELIDVFATQSAVAREISNSLHLEIQPESVGTLQGMPTHSVKAYDLYLKARSIDRSEPESEAMLTRQQEYLEQALQEDPDFVEAWAVLNDVYDSKIETMRRLGWFVPEGSDKNVIYKDLFDNSVYALKKAVALDPDKLETLIARASGAVGEEHLNGKMSSKEEVSALRRKMMDYTLEKYPDSATAWYILGWWQYVNANDIDAARPFFKKALELDPLHARLVGGALNFYRLAADEEMVAMLYERLTQIAPEKGSEQHLGKVSLNRKLWALISEFALSGDQALIEPMGDLLSSADVTALNPLDARSIAATVLTIQNDLEGLAQLPLAPLIQADYVFDKNASSETRHSYISLMAELLRQDRDSGVAEKAARTAELILLRIEEMPRCEHVDGLFAQAYATLDQQDKAWALVNKLLVDEKNLGDSFGTSGYAALAMLDVDQAAERLLELDYSGHVWNMLNVAAIFHLSYRDVLVHPDIQAYFVKEGKWIDYLADRVPEYEQYRK